MNDKVSPNVENALGLRWRERKGVWTAVWQARSDIVKRGFRPTMVHLWRGEGQPSDDECEYISKNCNDMQAEMLAWSYNERPPEVTQFQGTIKSLIACYLHDPDSPYRKLRYRSKENYRSFLKRIETDYGSVKIEDIRARELLRWHEAWSASGHIAMAHGLVGSLRTITTFGATILESQSCLALKTLLGSMRFAMAKPRTERLTAEMANAFREVAHKNGMHSMALAQAIQFEGMLRQRDVIGEFVPMDEPGASDVFYTDSKGRDWKWQRGIRWNEIDANLILKHVTSKRQKEVEIDLRIADMVVEEFARLPALPQSGPVIVSELTGRPYENYEFRRLWRKLATLAGIPKEVRNQDSRAGAISEATDAGADLEHIRHAATHSDIKMTQRYSRGAAEKGANVLRMRAAFRQNKSGK